MVHPHRSASWCLSAAAHYEHQAKHAADPTAQQKFLEVAAKWRQLAQNDQSRKRRLPLSSENVDPEQSSPKSFGALGMPANFSQLFVKLDVRQIVNVDTFAKLLRQTSRAGRRLLLLANEVGRRRKY